MVPREPAGAGGDRRGARGPRACRAQRRRSLPRASLVAWGAGRPPRGEGTRRAAKLDPSLTFDTVPPGVANLETLLPMLYSEGVRRGRLTLARLVEVLATVPARIAGLHPRKGVLAPGSDADVVVFDPNARRTIRSSEMHSACDYDPYEGWDVTGWPEVVLSRGEVVFERG